MGNSDKVGLDSAAIVCQHIAQSEARIRYAQRDEPEEPADSGWQFVCGADSEDWSKAQVWSVSEVLQTSPGLEEFIDCPPGTSLVRSESDDHWALE